MLFFLAVAVWMLIGCEMAIDEPSTGRVVGKAIFLNNDSHEDIIVSLEILEKGITRNVSRAINGVSSDAAFFDFNGGQNYDGYRYSDFRVRPISAY